MKTQGAVAGLGRCAPCHPAGLPHGAHCCLTRAGRQLAQLKTWWWLTSARQAQTTPACGAASLRLSYQAAHRESRVQTWACCKTRWKRPRPCCGSCA
eukprot:365126-Chlamydomonas_euryale.AAC.61